MSTRSGRRRWLVVCLVFVAIVLNYVDRQILALLKPTLQSEFGWSDRDYSHMASAFQFAAAIAFLGTGWFIDRVGLRKGFAIGVGVWSLAGMAHAFASTVTGFMACRIVLGAAESIGTPAAVKTAATYFNARERSVVLGLGGIAPNVGAILTPLLIPLMAIMWGWQATFLIAGGLGLLWVIVWLAVRIPEQPRDDAGTAAVSIPWSSLLRDRRQWAVIVGKALTDQVWWFLLFFMPDLFHRVFGLSQGELGAPVAFAYFVAALGGITSGFLPTWLLARGWTINGARKTTMLIYALLVLPVPLLVTVDSAWVAAIILGAALFAHQGFSTNLFGLTTDVFPARIVGSAIGIGAFAGNLAGMAMIEFAGWNLDAGHGYLPMLLICATTYLVALGLIHLILPRIVAVDEGRDEHVVVLGH